MADGTTAVAEDRLTLIFLELDKLCERLKLPEKKKERFYKLTAKVKEFAKMKSKIRLVAIERNVPKTSFADLSCTFSTKQKEHLPYGSWKSPLTAKVVAENAIVFQDFAIDSDTESRDSKIYWSEMRPAEEGRHVICSWSPDKPQRVEWTKPKYDARNTVHSFGGGAFFVFSGTVYFINHSDQVMYKQTSPEEEPVPITPAGKKWRYADGVYSRATKRVFCVREDQSSKKEKRTIVSFPVEPKTQVQSILVEGRDFYSSPKFSQDGSWLAWIQWDYPDMPWDSAEVWRAKLTKEGVLETSQKVAGGKKESVMTPIWSPSGVLHYISDKTKWWNLHSETGDSVCCEKELGTPHWSFGVASYAFNPNNEKEIALTYGKKLTVYNIQTKTSTPLDNDDFTSYENPRFSSDGYIYVTASSPEKLPAILRVDSKSGKAKVAFSSCGNSNAVSLDYISIPENITFPTGKDMKEKAYAYFYSPKNKDCDGPEGELPPLLVCAHTGPTKCASDSLSLEYQYWTSRGFAILDVDYRGSTGYGREYRNKLNQNWGVFDVEDCCNGADYLAKELKLVNPNCLVIKGSSAGGYTVLRALTFKSGVFRAGCSSRGISDLELLEDETHEFERYYLDSLVAKWPEGKEVFRDRSPIKYEKELICPVLFFHAEDAKSVPANQSESMYDKLKKQGNTQTTYVLFSDEETGCKKEENMMFCLEEQLTFWGEIFGFNPALDRTEESIFVSEPWYKNLASEMEKFAMKILRKDSAKQQFVLHGHYLYSLSL
eukprot:m.117195 g.117195  ORF g.117195 m.117195 type:complete len:771 (+) comp37609_c1_seq3:918-3230(+)